VIDILTGAAFKSGWFLLTNPPNGSWGCLHFQPTPPDSTLFWIPPMGIGEESTSSLDRLDLNDPPTSVGGI
jgi:hypothetical protein